LRPANGDSAVIRRHGQILDIRRRFRNAAAARGTAT
jgi:hypothetical protein